MTIRSYDQVFIGGSWQDGSGGRIEVISPHTEEVIAHAAAGSEHDVDLAVGAARGTRRVSSELVRGRAARNLSHALGLR